MGYKSISPHRMAYRIDYDGKEIDRAPSIIDAKIQALHYVNKIPGRKESLVNIYYLERSGDALPTDNNLALYRARLGYNPC
jgi:hypothetical protein